MAKSPKEIVNKINAFSPNPGAYFLLKVSDKEPIRVVVTKAGFSNSKILQNDLLKTPVGIELLKVKPAGKTEMDMNSWLNGLKNLSEFEIL